MAPGPRPLARLMVGLNIPERKNLLAIAVFNPTLRRQQTDLCEFKTGQIYTVGSYLKTKLTIRY